MWVSVGMYIETITQTNSLTDSVVSIVFQRGRRQMLTPTHPKRDTVVCGQVETEGEKHRMYINTKTPRTTKKRAALGNNSVSGAIEVKEPVL